MKKMKTILLAILLAATGAIRAAAGDIPTTPGEIAEALRPALPPGWTCTAGTGTITVSRVEQVTIFNPINPPARAFDEALDDYYKKNGHAADYKMAFVFRPRLSDQQLEILKAVRAQVFKKISDDPKLDDRTKMGLMLQENSRHGLPVFYNASFSIYFQRTDAPPLQVYPKAAALERDKVLKVLSNWMTAYEGNN